MTLPRSLAVLFVATLALADLSPALAEEGRALLARGMALFDRGELKKAERVLGQAIDRLAAGPERAQAHLHLGLVRANLGLRSAASRDFVRALIDDPKVDLDRERVPPSVLALFDEARASLSGVVAVEGGGGNLQVEIPGQGRWPLPMRRAIPVGEHLIRVVDTSGKEVLQEKVLIRPGLERVIRVVGQPSPASPPSPPPPALEPARPAIAVKPQAPPSASPLPVETPKPESPGRPTPEGPPEPLAPSPLPGPAAAKAPVPPAPQASPAAPLASGASPAAPLASSASPLPSLPPRMDQGWFTGLRVAGVSSLAGGVVLGFLSLGFGLAARQAEEDFQAAKRTGPYDLAYRYQQDAQSRARWSNVFLGLGGAALTTGVVLVLWPRGDHPKTARVVPTGLGATLAMGF